MGFTKNNIVLVLALVCLFISFSITTAYEQSYNNTRPDNKNPKLESVILQLIQAKDPEEFSKAHNIYLEDSRARVIIEIVEGTTSLPDYVQEETRYGNKVQVLVPINKIAALSEENNVTFIRAPMRSYQDAPEHTIVPTITEPPKSGSNSSIFLIVFMVLITLILKKGSVKFVEK
jgi:hypothetical protein